MILPAWGLPVREDEGLPVREEEALPVREEEGLPGCEEGDNEAVGAAGTTSTLPFCHFNTFGTTPTEILNKALLT